MNERIEFLKEQTLSGKNKTARAPFRSSDFDMSRIDASIPERKAMAVAAIFDKMPIFIGEGELIVGTRTLYSPWRGNEDGHDRTLYNVETFHKYLNEEDIALFGKDYSRTNKQHYTPDLGIALEGGIGGIIDRARARMNDDLLGEHNREFLQSVIIVYEGLSRLILRYAEYAKALADKAEGIECERLSKIADVCSNIALGAPRNFREAVQLLWFAHLGTMIESGRFICYGRLDVILGKHIGDTDDGEALELIECLLLKMYDQADIKDGSSIAQHEGQLVVTLGGVLENGESAYNRVTKLFLMAIGEIMLPDPEFNIRISKKNPEELLDLATALSVRGANFVSYYNDDLFVESLSGAGISPEDARSYGFDLCQDINIPGKSDSWCLLDIRMIRDLLAFLDEGYDYDSFESLLSAFKVKIAEKIALAVKNYNEGAEIAALYRDGKYDEYFEKVREGIAPVWFGRSPACPMPLLSGLYHGTIESAQDMIYDTYPIKHKGAMVGTAVETVNSLAAIKKVVFDEKKYTLEEVVAACREDFQGAKGAVIQGHLKNAPKWGNDDEYVDLIAKDFLEFCLLEFTKYEIYGGGRLLSGIHQPHPVTTGRAIGATPDGRNSGDAVSVTMTPGNGTMKNGATAALRSASIFDPKLLQWNYCFMINYYSSMFDGDEGREKFKNLLKTYFALGGMQHQPNIVDKATLLHAQDAPERYKDLVVRLWGVSAHFVDLPKDIQDELIARL
jgi:formate C-acetyltransferase